MRHLSIASLVALAALPAFGQKPSCPFDDLNGLTILSPLYPPIAGAMFAALVPSAPVQPQGCADDGEWTRAGLGGGGVFTALAFDPIDTNRFVVGTDCAGVFRTCDGGATWTASSRGLSNYYVESTALHPTDGATIFAATLKGVSRSTNDGENWSTALELPLNAGGNASFSTVTVDPYDPQVVWCGIGHFRGSTGDAGGDAAGQHPHVWRSAGGGASGTWQALDRIMINGTEIKAGIHSIVPCAPGTSTPPGADLLVVSTTDGVFLGYWTGSAWGWLDITSNLPHRDCRDLEVVMDPVTGAFQRIYVALNSHSASGDPASIYANANGWGGGVWYTSGPGNPWSPTSFANGSDGLHLETANESTCACDPIPPQPAECKPKNMRDIALDREHGFLYLGLTERSTQTEGVWRADVSAPQWTWQRMTATHDWTSCHDNTCRQKNVDFDYFPTIGSVMSLAVQPVSGDVLFGTKIALYRCSGGDCMPTACGMGQSPTWQALHTVITPGSPTVYRSEGLEATQTYQTVVVPETPSVRFMAEFDHGLVRSDDSGANWRYVGSASQQQPYITYGNTRNCRGLFRNPGIANEWLGIFGRWSPTAEFELWRTLDGVPNDSSVWTEALPVNQPQTALKIRDVLFLDGTHVLVAEESGLYKGTRDGSGVWSFTAEDLSLLNGKSTCAVDLIAAPGTGLERPILAAFTWVGLPSPKNGGILRRASWTAPWVLATHTGFPQDDFKSIQCLEWCAADPNVVFAGRASSGTGVTGAVLRSNDAGATWSTTAGQGFGFPPQFDVVGLTSLFVPENGSMVERLFAAARPVLSTGDAAWIPSIFGGVFHSADRGANWVDRSTGLDFGFSNFVSRDPVQPYRLHYGTRGNGAWSLDDGTFAGIGPTMMVKAARTSGPGGQLNYSCTQQVIFLRNEGSWKERVFFDFSLASLAQVPPARIARVELEVNVFTGALSASSAVQAKRMTNSVANLWNPPLPTGMPCSTLFSHINSTTTYVSVSAWSQGQTRKRFDLGAQAVTDLRAALQGSGVFSVGLKLALEGNNDPTEHIELYNLTGDHRLYVSYDL
jgi:hypothetical protein